MSNELQVSFKQSAQVYAVLRNQTSGFVWDMSGGTGGAFSIFSSGAWQNYAISLSEQGIAGYYVGSIPPAVPPGIMAVVAKQQITGSPLQTDPTIGTGDYNWNGSQVVPLSDLATSGQIGQIAPLKIYRGQMIQNFLFKMVSSADHVTPFVSGVVSGQILRDAGSFGPLQSGAFTEVGLGFYRTTLTSGDLNANTAALTLSANGISGGTADQRDFSLVLQRSSGSV